MKLQSISDSGDRSLSNCVNCVSIACLSPCHQTNTGRGPFQRRLAADAFRCRHLWCRHLFDEDNLIFFCAHPSMSLNQIIQTLAPINQNNRATHANMRAKLTKQDGIKCTTILNATYTFAVRSLLSSRRSNVGIYFWVIQQQITNL